MKLKQKFAVITGASRGLGAVIAEHFVREGASVILCARTRQALVRLASKLRQLAGPTQKIVVCPADVRQEADAKRIAQRAFRSFGRIDILVNCAGVPGPRGPIERVNWAQWKEAVQTNLLGPVYLCRVIVPLMKKKRHGKIINISGGGATKPLPHLSAYAATKAALVRFTETLADELRDFGIEVNAVAPGVLATRMVDRFLEVDREVLGREYVAEVQRQKENPRPACDRAAQLCVFLASAESNGITGKLISAVWDPWPRLAKFRSKLARSDVYTLRRITPRDRGWDWG